MADKKIKIKSNFLLGRKEFERYFLSNGIYMFDVSDHLERLPDDVQLAFQLWNRWTKYGKDQPFRPDEEKLTDKSSWFDQVIRNNSAAFEGRPCPLLHVSADENLYRFISNLGVSFWAFIPESAYQLALELWDESEIKFLIGKLPDTPVSIEFASQRVGTIAQHQGIPEKLLAWGLHHFLPVYKEEVESVSN